MYQFNSVNEAPLIQFIITVAKALEPGAEVTCFEVEAVVGIPIVKHEQSKSITTKVSKNLDVEVAPATLVV